MNGIRIALVICTYKREKYVKKNIEMLLASDFFKKSSSYYGNLDIFLIDNASEISIDNREFVHLIHNKNSGGSGGFQRGLKEIRKSKEEFTHVVFMDDDVKFEDDLFERLYHLIESLPEEDRDRPIAGRMFRMDIPNIQWTAAEYWDEGRVGHIGHHLDMSLPENRVDMNNSDGAEYGGWWFCCYPYSFCEKNDILPFFIHCDDVEYGLRCGKQPIIAEGIQVWHEIFATRQTPVISYYDWRNSRIVNAMYGFDKGYEVEYKRWKDEITEFHLDGDFYNEYMLILAMRDFMRGPWWFTHVNCARHHKRISSKPKNYRILSKFIWRVTAVKMRLFYGRTIKQYQKLQRKMDRYN